MRLPKILVLTPYGHTNLRRQLPHGDMVWDGVAFTFDPHDTYDAVALINQPIDKFSLHVPPGRIWNIIQEPPITNAYRKLNKGHSKADKIFMTDTTNKGCRYVLGQTALPWHPHKDYDFLSALPDSKKTKNLSWTTSNKANTAGTRQRMQFLQSLQAAGVDFDLFGRGFQPIEDKWDALHPYRYALAIENSSSDVYWTEKISDCFLAWTVPLYFGCKNIDRFFPAASYLRIDLDDPKTPDRIKEIVASDYAEQNRAAIAEARDLVLNKYNLFNLLAKQMHVTQASEGFMPNAPKKHIILQPDGLWLQRLARLVHTCMKKMRP